MTVELLRAGTEPPAEAIYLSGAGVGPSTGIVRGAHVDIDWEVGSAIPTGANAVIEYRSRYFWDYDERFFPWTQVARGDNFEPCTSGSTTCITFTRDDLMRGTPFTLEMRIVQDGSVLETSPQLKAAAPNASANLLVPELTVALDETTEQLADPATGPFVMELQFTEPYTTGYLGALLTEVVQDLAPGDFDIQNGTVTAVEVWSGGTYKVKVTPTTLGDPVTVSLPAASVKGVGEGLTSDGANEFTKDNIASNEIVTQTAADNNRQSRVPLTARFQDVPSSHDGSRTFTFRIAFSEGVANSYKAIRDHTLTVGGGTVKTAKRVRGQNKLWAITIKPSGRGAVSILLKAGRPCSRKGAPCTADGRTLSNSVATTIVGPPGLSVDDVEVNEGPGATLEFAVTLDRVASDTVTVDYATSDGTATAAADYTAASGTLTFAPGDTAATVNVTVLDDAHDEGRETLTLTLAPRRQPTGRDRTPSRGPPSLNSWKWVSEAVTC